MNRVSSSVFYLADMMGEPDRDPIRLDGSSSAGIRTNLNIVLLYNCLQNKIKKNDA